MKSEKSVPELEMELILKEGEQILDDAHLTTRQGRVILDAGYKLLAQCKRLRESRDNWRNKFESSNGEKESLEVEDGIKDL